MDPSLAAQYGALGILTIGATTIAGILWKKLQSEQEGRLFDAKLNAERIDALCTEHKAEMKILLERLIEGNGTVVREYNGLAERTTKVLDSLTERLTRGPHRRGSGG